MAATLSKVSVTSFSGAFVTRLTMTIARLDRMNAGSSSAWCIRENEELNAGSSS